jgi:methionine-rich copper-binding protein CopC
MRTRQWSRLLVMTTVVVAMIVLSTAGVSAHAQYKSSDPPANGTVQKAPAQVAITFSEETDPLKSGGSVADASGTTVSTGFKVDLNQRTNMTIDLKPNLPNGVYTVKWNTLTDDDNAMANGTFTFTVQAAATGTGTATTGTAPAATTAPATTTAATATVAATVAPTATRPATTPVATGTGGGATATAAPATLPNTGDNGSGNGTPWAIAILVVAALIIAGGLAFRLRTARR